MQRFEKMTWQTNGIIVTEFPQNVGRFWHKKNYRNHVKFIFTFFRIESSERFRDSMVSSVYFVVRDFVDGCTALNRAFLFARNENNIINLNVHVIAGNWQH